MGQRSVSQAETSEPSHRSIFYHVLQLIKRHSEKKITLCKMETSIARFPFWNSIQDRKGIHHYFFKVSQVVKRNQETGLCQVPPKCSLLGSTTKYLLLRSTWLPSMTSYASQGILFFVGVLRNWRVRFEDQGLIFHPLCQNSLQDSIWEKGSQYSQQKVSASGGIRVLMHLRRSQVHNKWTAVTRVP